MDESGRHSHELAAVCRGLVLSQALPNTRSFHYQAWRHICPRCAWEATHSGQGHAMHKPRFSLKGFELSGCQARGWMGTVANTQLSLVANKELLPSWPLTR